MKIRAASGLWPHLEKYEELVDELARDCSHDGSSGSGSPGNPFREKCRIAVLLDLPASGGEDPARLRQEYCRITQKLDEAVGLMDPPARDRLLRDLREYVHAYHAAVCRLHLGQDEPDIAGILLLRDAIGELCRVLGDKTDLSGIGTLLAVLDANLPPKDPGMPSCGSGSADSAPVTRRYLPVQEGSQRRVSPFLH